jgi:hypothetical protein
MESEVSTQAAPHWVVPGAQVQSPPSQTSLFPQATPQTPQLSALDDGSMQLPPHSMVGGAQPQVPALHCSAGPQASPQAPQFAGSLPGSMHCGGLPQASWVAPQSPLQEAFRQTWPLAQVNEQSPQFVGSLVVSTHDPPQLVSPGWQLSTQFPLSQSSSRPQG